MALTIEDVARAYQEANPGTTWDASLAWARAEVTRQAKRQTAVQDNGAATAAPEQPPAPPPTPGWKFPMYEAADVLMGVDNGSIVPLEGLQAAVVLLVSAAAKL